MAAGRKTGGRTAGTPNKMTATAKEAFQTAFDELGGTEGLAEWAKSGPKQKEVFYTLYARLIPTDLTTGGKELPSVTVNIPPLTDGGPQR